MFVKMNSFICMTSDLQDYLLYIIYDLRIYRYIEYIIIYII